ncbi:hypothetical protein AJ80_00699 [Polytolypa hystricis UAMH7299]|uniref:Calmodulin n=1 Tax=Polytolypa hystricis (strain UAMH7299) TaxID=1447883 RepID=A0A2B7YUE7_POLH7|nr:hypothetical protein AJ80_00699 [Polytolypa hystricis UAMH7299]
MPPKRRNTTTSTTAPKPKKARQSKLAKENDISAEEEAEIKEAFRLFAVENEDFSSEKEGVIETPDVRRAMVALGLPPSSPAELTSIISAVDPDGVGYVPYAPFLSVCALKLHSRTEASIAAEVEHAFNLFARGSGSEGGTATTSTASTAGGGGTISLNHLRRVARELKEDVKDEVLRDMIREANGGEGVHVGVSLEQFREVMIRAGVF